MLARNMDPQVREGRYVFCVLADGRLPQGVVPLGTFREKEGLTVIVAQPDADRHGLGYEAVFGLITLGVLSDLSAVGFLAAVTAQLAAADLPCNVISAFHHDHLFVPAERLQDALAVLQRHARDSR